MIDQSSITRNNTPFRRKSAILHSMRQVVRYYRRLYVVMGSGGKVQVGAHVVIGRNPDMRPFSAGYISNNVGIGKNFTAEVDFYIGEDVLISSNVSFIGNQHPFDDPSSTVFRQGRRDNDRIVIEGDNLIGFGCVIVGSITIGRGTIVGAGAVVVQSLPPNTICVGVPAKPVRLRHRTTNAIVSEGREYYGID